MGRFLWICFGGAVGTGARYLVSGWAVRLFGARFPWGTLAVNVIGSFLIAALMHAAVTTSFVSADLRLVLVVGVLGGFTTYSSFNYETMSYFQSSAWLLGFLNILVTVATCLVAGAAGLAAGRWLAGG